MNRWTETLTAAQLEAQYALTASLDPSFAATDRKWWETRTVNELKNAMAGAWNCSQGDTYQRARTYLEMKGA